MSMLLEAIEVFGKMSDNALDLQATKACREFDPVKHDPVVFLRNLRDLVVRYSWGSGAVVSAITALLDATGHEPEDPNEMDARRKLLETLEQSSGGVERMLHANPNALEAE